MQEQMDNISRDKNTEKGIKNMPEIKNIVTEMNAFCEFISILEVP